jgi:hypothetical protein
VKQKNLVLRIATFPEALSSCSWAGAGGLAGNPNSLIAAAICSMTAQTY